ncbi:cationic amino acid transporter 8 vacuolar [Prunus yedoensis var. nudiflora]|uniref:Cationic amino acid transporter 8 vacuolar n=1 Tax=Prunus yedoensis var. nudiflora TaxID=2094558 RepID=A0A314Y0G2_PRUYE|nr:cationic amino acid transporter 8 vacuolar [Prunus yedoensis var. nudiflora]
MEEEDQQNPQQRSYWSRWSKHDFFPEPTFQNLSSYKDALSHTPSRLKDRLLHRSSDSFELLQLPKQSENRMKRCLTWWDLATREDAGPSIVLSYAISGFSALLSVLCYTEFAVEIPVAGGSFSYLRIELGDFVAFIAAGNILLEALVGSAGLGRSWSSYFASMFRTDDTDFLRIRVKSFPDGFNLLDPIAVVVLLVANSIAMSGTRRTSVLNWIASIASAFIIVFIIIVGFVRGNTANLTPFFPFGAEGCFKAAAVVFWSYTGFDMVANMAEEAKKPSRDIPVGLIGSMSLITVVYCLMALALSMLQKYTEIDKDAAYSVAFEAIGMDWAKYLVSICALKGMTTSLLVGSMGQARYTTQIARAHMIPPWFALVHPKTGTPIYATVMVTLVSAVVALFTSLDVLSSVFSFSTLCIFMFVAIALLVRRSMECRQAGVDLVCSFWCYLVIGDFVDGIPSKAPIPKVWGVPLVPWLPALSIGINVFLIGSLGYVAFLRFFICTAVMVAYYLLVGVHATYDVARQIEQESKTEEGNQSAS